ncbi:MAG TPA: hypothetical protein VIJ55_05765 [Acetobacteraceae bacterium]
MVFSVMPLSVRVLRAPQLLGRGLEKLGEPEHRVVLLVPAYISATIAWPRLVDAAHTVFPQELADAVPGLDALRPLTGPFDDVIGLEGAHRQTEVSGEAADVGTAHLHIARHPAAQTRALEAIQAHRANID